MMLIKHTCLDNIKRPMSNHALNLLGYESALKVCLLDAQNRVWKSMVVRLRLARFGRRNLPFYRIFAADSRAPRDGRHIEIVGHYNPIPAQDGHKHIGLDIDRIKYWLAVGAQPSRTVGRLLGQAGIIPKPPTPESRQRGPKKEEKAKKK